MSIYRKIFLAIFLVSSALLAISAYSFYLFTLREITAHHTGKYRAVAATIAESISKLERTTEGHMSSALEALRYYTDAHPVPSDETLASIEKGLSVSSIEFIQPDGRFVRSTSYKVAELPNLFALCGDYRELFTGQRPFDHTPLMPSLVDGRVWKYSLVPTSDRQHVISVGMEIDFVDDLFRALFDDDKQLLAIGLSTPSGRSLGDFRRRQSKGGARGLDAGGIGLSGVTVFEDRIPASVNRCCECVTKGLAADPGGGFFYLLRLEISLDELREGTRKLRLMLGLLLILGFLLSYLMSRVIARRLSSRIAQINAKTDELMSLRDLGSRINMPGTDEISKLGQKFDRLLESLEGAQKDLLAAEKARTLGTLASQVAHDIRSPLAALDVAVASIQADIPEDTRLMLRSAVGRIRDISNDLIVENRRTAHASSLPAATPETPTVHLLSSLIEEVVSEKRLQLSSRMGVEVEAPLGRETYGLFASVQAAELKRALSNLINNAVEAIADRGRVTLRLAGEDGEAILSVSDDGKGIPEEVLARLGERGLSHGKADGSGLGLHYARAAVERWGGRLTIQSTVGRGTTVEIRLPLAAPPAWFIERIALESSRTVVVLDDDRAIHATWDRLLAPFAEQRLTVLHFTEARTLREWLPEHRDTRFLGLIDYELLRQHTTGLDLIEQEGIADRAILVTSRYAEPAIVERAARLGLKIIPKQLVGLVPIVQAAAAERPVAAAAQGPRVLVVDDDEMIAWAWRKQQKRLGFAELRTFSSMEACEAAAPDYGTFDVAFVDLNIDGTSWSIADTTRHLKQRGVKRVFVATGDPGAVPPGRCPDADGVAAEKVPRDLAPYLGGIDPESHSLKS